MQKRFAGEPISDNQTRFELMHGEVFMKRLLCVIALALTGATADLSSSVAQERKLEKIREIDKSGFMDRL